MNALAVDASPRNLARCPRNPVLRGRYPQAPLLEPRFAPAIGNDQLPGFTLALSPGADVPL
ncbi:hypothetical protein ACFYXH_05285 [Streptomyces sp. NPDC002730]|uniref:hypothetical protein n=1 Tax=Streptomyces sp. NPDC002730 TaxID=3364662 RepID=UPI0036C07C73